MKVLHNKLQSQNPVTENVELEGKNLVLTLENGVLTLDGSPLGGGGAAYPDQVTVINSPTILNTTTHQGIVFLVAGSVTLPATAPNGTTYKFLASVNDMIIDTNGKIINNYGAGASVKIGVSPFTIVAINTPTLTWFPISGTQSDNWLVDHIYHVGNIVNDAGVKYISIANSNIGNITSDTTKWFKLEASGGGGTSNVIIFDEDEVAPTGNIYNTWTTAMAAVTASPSPTIDLYIHKIAPAYTAISVDTGAWDLSRCRLFVTPGTLLPILVFGNGASLASLPESIDGLFIANNKTDVPLFQSADSALQKLVYVSGPSSFITLANVTQPTFSLSNGADVQLICLNGLGDGTPISYQGLTSVEPVAVQSPSTFTISLKQTDPMDVDVLSSNKLMFSGNGNVNINAEFLSDKYYLKTNANFTGNFSIGNRSQDLLQQFRRESNTPKFRVVNACQSSNILLSTLVENVNIDGVILASQIVPKTNTVLLTAQSDPAENGIYEIRYQNPPKRLENFNTLYQSNIPVAYDHDFELRKALIVVAGGTINGGKIFQNTNATAINLGVTPITYSEVSLISHSEPAKTFSNPVNCASPNDNNALAETSGNYATEFILIDVNVTAANLLTSVEVSTAYRTTNWFTDSAAIGSGTATSSGVNDPRIPVQVYSLVGSTKIVVEFVPATTGVHVIRVQCKYQLA